MIRLMIIKVELSSHIEVEYKSKLEFFVSPRELAQLVLRLAEHYTFNRYAYLIFLIKYALFLTVYCFMLVLVSKVGFQSLYQS